ncbi:UDP-N-acetylmuramate:L-alanyl-gamma-D-glutamyl-meso-diaminopimelate ligase [Solemya velum gill symbiont]|uniref:UDP-N-acetylmuramate:L-alanyl-gamma-D-glutamyl- meso-diaminopimelate ligase n=1 Tax=Solemya velum gill symbiont TaxID=2340 RepID=UPI000997132E|nr:UDP-N-acetylmuramate:L-alanyl-gamma-D-glutamyl-meso-diaminopimelate ligase [Solemya velum gill symbiont]OOZ46049.1 UDP-N-acetylmuramate:L-alanyl-gamma-D-glutamyl-meso-diaminopimelate ligase [Solemya velum gill symbiont]OOZ47636.1 UDP-N-acetylmuramate:L-alanyl-gamma-D-glutamyl-meso-diaminopimelate ligase [Solemya velum gill symbiont]OOZ50112.1 UDP-N-acetylmuramate:L-alanyl-gamma-D-glutamyl-meso-diaminopimelate ligase [Solemya velum gill symbiont]OOZ52586.1 UDP-N-acetylmuramate:L-alanyl-gamma-
MHIHILGICGTFMGGIALLAQQAGHRVTGSDAHVYPPMSDQLEDAGISLMSGYEAEHLKPAPDMVVVGNAMTRGNPAIEYMLDAGLRYTSGPQWLAEQILSDRRVIAAAGTHGKTTTSGMIAWILEDAGLNPGFLIGGVPKNFGLSAHLGDAPFFVVEADEYDTAFFDKRSKFVHYRPRTTVLNNLEFDHADIFDDLPMIQRQFHHLVRTVPGNGLLIAPADDQPLKEVLEMGCWTPLETLGPDGNWQAELLEADGSRFHVSIDGTEVGIVDWDLTGDHNVRNALASIAAARHAGVPASVAVEALGKFENVKRRMELRGEVDGIRLYDDFAHHPTAIETTLTGLRKQVGDSRIIAVLEPRSNTMRMGIHAESLPASLQQADRALVYSPASLEWDAESVFRPLGEKAEVCSESEKIVDLLKQEAKAGDTILVMSNGGFENIHQRILDALNERGG